MDKKFSECITRLEELRAPIAARKARGNADGAEAHECLTRFDEATSALWALRQQATHGDNDVPRENFLDENERSWMWAWIKGAQKWQAWDQCRGMSETDAKFLFIDGVQKLEHELPTLLERWTQAE